MRALLLLALLAGLLTGCAIAPLGGGLTARPLATGAVQVDPQLTGYAKANGIFVLVPAARVLYGVTDRFTIGGVTELKTLTAIARYSLLASDDGPSAAVAFLVTYGGGRFSYTGSAIGSWRAGGFEPYAALRFHLASYDVNQLDMSFFAAPASVRFQFPSANVGLRYWIDGTTAAGLDAVWLIDSGATKFAVKTVWSLVLSFTL